VLLQVRDQVEPLPVHLDMSQQDLQAGLEAAAAAVRQQGKRVAAVLFVHPTNPQGLLFSRQQLRSIVSWCLKSQVHCIA
jgi:aspartate/methionine/tyrosine aminotransferase